MPQYYQPSQFFISAITLGNPTIITTTEDNNYVVGQLVRLLIPSGYGSVQLNGVEGYVVAIPAANQVTVNINSFGANAFINAASKFQQAQIIAVGDVNTGVTSSNGLNILPTGFNLNTAIPGSFINISP